MVRFSIVYPTRNRSLLLEAGLKALTQQTNQDFEIVVADNPSEDELSVERICEGFPQLRIVYKRAPRELGMTENWNHALQFCSGEYVLYLTDKMMLLPATLENVELVFEGLGPQDIVSWPSDAYSSEVPGDYLGPGIYNEAAGSWPGPDNRTYRVFDPQAELEFRLNAKVSRPHQKPHDYARGKICFGTYSVDLINRIQHEHGQLFWPISPDYTSMVLALGTASRAAEFQNSGVVSINTDISNGELNAKQDDRAFVFMVNESKANPQVMENLLIPNLYAAQHAVVGSDYMEMLKKLGVSLRPNLMNWTRHCFDDLNRRDRTWSSDQVRQQQMDIYRNFVQRLKTGDRLLVLLHEIRFRMLDKASQLLRGIGADRVHRKVRRYLRVFKQEKVYVGNVFL